MARPAHQVHTYEGEMHRPLGLFLSDPGTSHGENWCQSGCKTGFLHSHIRRLGLRRLLSPLESHKAASSSRPELHHGKESGCTVYYPAAWLDPHKAQNAEKAKNRPQGQSGLEATSALAHWS